MNTFEHLSTAIIEQSQARMAQTHLDAQETVEAEGYVVIRHQPHRRKMLKALEKPGCPFCRNQATEFLAEHPYHGMILSQNLAPYGHLSLILRTRLHHQQDEIIDFLESHGRHFLGELPSGITLYCNQFAGNSQAHLHMQYINRLLPVTGITLATPKTWSPKWQTHEDFKYALFDGASDEDNPEQWPIRHFLGCFITGTAKAVAIATAKYLRAARAKNIKRFNFVIWRHNNTDRITAYVILRNPDTIRTRHPDYPVLFGALTTAGFITEERLPAEMPPFDYESYAKYARTKLLAPINPWT